MFRRNHTLHAAPDHLSLAAQLPASDFPLSLAITGLTHMHPSPPRYWKNWEHAFNWTQAGLLKVKTDWITEHPNLFLLPTGYQLHRKLFGQQLSKRQLTDRLHRLPVQL